MASFSGIKNTLLAEQVEEQLDEYITKLPMKAGDKLPNEFKLAEMFGVGRSTVREAVKLLVSRNVLETRRGSGTYVKDLVPTDLDPLNLRIWFAVTFWTSLLLAGLSAKYALILSSCP